MTAPKALEIDWSRASLNPVALVIMDWVEGGVCLGATLARQEDDESLFGIRHVEFGDGYGHTIAAWSAQARKDGQEVRDWREEPGR